MFVPTTGQPFIEVDANAAGLPGFSRPWQRRRSLTLKPDRLSIHALFLRPRSKMEAQSPSAFLSTSDPTSASSSACCCRVLSETEIGNRVFYPSQESYKSSVNSYFSLGARLTPKCIVQPSTAKEVSVAVSALVSEDQKDPCKFAIRSGGHTIWAGSANIENGVTIDLSSLNSVTYNEEESTASIGPGARWFAVYEALSEHGVAVPGGRAGTVGVGGLTLGGGNSFFANRYGFVCDNVANFEVVLASGQIVNANSKENADLWQALKGGSNNFGIVAKIDLYTFPFESLWGGVVVYPGSTARDQISAFVNFNNKIEDDPYASVITFWQSTSEVPDAVIVNAYEYTKPEPNPPILGEFLSIPGNISDSMRITDLQSVTRELEQASDTYVGFWTITFSNYASIIEKAVELHNTLVEGLIDTTSTWSIMSMFQPIPTIISEHSKERGGNVLGLDRATENLVLFLVDIAWDKREEEVIFRSAGENMIAQLSAYAESVDGLNEYIYLDYADYTQNPLASYGAENLRKMKRVSKKYDPNGVFQAAVPGGFKLANAGEIHIN